jgi:outer membrane protein insertion porin family
MKFKFLFSLLFVLLSISSVVHSDETGFVVKDIQVSGLQRISVGTVFNYLYTLIAKKISNQYKN